MSVMRINTISAAILSLKRAWPKIVRETRQVQGSELHYQAMIYHALRDSGGVPLMQIGMNVKQWISSPVSKLFRTLDGLKHKAFQGGFEPIPDVVIFRPAIGGDWRRRRYEATLRNMLVAIEIKASERKNGRLRGNEIAADIRKLHAHREEVRNIGADVLPIMMVIDVAAELNERMTANGIALARETAEDFRVGLLYVSQDSESFQMSVRERARTRKIHIIA